MKIVTSTQNPAVRALRELGQAKARAQRGLFLAEGVKLCAEALRDAQVETVLCDEARAGEFSTLLAACGDVLLAPAHIVASACQTQTPQGIVASVRMPAPLALAEPPAALLALDGVQDPGNVGTMLRTAEAAGFGGALRTRLRPRPCGPPWAAYTGCRSGAGRWRRRWKRFGRRAMR